MPVETFTYISSLVASNPPSSDGLAQADDHIRGIKSVLKNTFPNINNAVNASDEEFNQLNTKTFTGDGWTFQGDVTLQSDTTVARLTATEYLKGPGACPTGMIADFLTTSVPPGWLNCNGQAVSRTTYAALFALLGTTYGAGDGSTTFNLPDLSDRYRRTGGTFSMGAFLNDDIKAHNHTGSTSSDGSHTHTGITDSQGAHNHTYFRPQTSIQAQGGDGVILSSGTLIGVGTDTQGLHAHNLSINAAGAHFHTFTTANTGGSETRPKTFVVNTFIKT